MSQSMIGSEQLPDALKHTASFPVLPSGAPYLLKTMSNEDVFVSDLVEVLAQFPMIAARLIGLANSAWSSPVAEVTTLDTACVRLGLNVVRSVSIALSVAAPFNSSRCPGFDVERFWTSALLTAEVCAWLSESTRLPMESDPQTVQVAGLLHNLGLLWLADAMPEETNAAIVATDCYAKQTLSKSLREHSGIDYAQAGGYLVMRWKLPDTFVVPIYQHCDAAYHDKFWVESSVVGAARMMVSALYSESEDVAINHHLKRLGLSHGLQLDVQEKAEAKLQHTRELARTLFSG